MNAASNDNKPKQMSELILACFDDFFEAFLQVTRGAQHRFEQADWQAVHDEMQHRLTMYKKAVIDVSADIKSLTGDKLLERELWQEAKAEFASKVNSHKNFEIAQTFFNSVYCYVFGHQRIQDVQAFVLTPERPATPLKYETITRDYKGDELTDLIKSVLSDLPLTIPFADIDTDARLIAEALLDAPRDKIRFEGDVEFAILESLFYRNKAAYVVGRVSSNGQSAPFVLPVLNNEQGGLYVDTVLYNEDAVSILFSFTRSYFMVDVSIPSRYVAFLKTLLPQKEIFELYSAMGFGKHAKTEFYRHAVASTIQSKDNYEVAPGIKGMVMLVFTRPSFDYVYKVIKDRFTPPKDMTREEVKEKYRLVKRWDRAGRMADTQEFTNLVFDRRRFSDELMAELEKEVPSLIQVSGNALILKHVYVERKMVPLNLYLRDATDEQTESVMTEYGNAIKQLASVNVFPGDMLLKNFGVTRHGRVVFYDYDEICPLTECNFRTIPEPKTEEQEYASTPWYPVADNDVFPEEFRLFFSGNRRAREVFDKVHPDIYEASFWSGLQDKINQGIYADVFPYRRRFRFKRS